jgi:glycosyltransferase involved in cell wall biosynthesis
VADKPKKVIFCCPTYDKPSMAMVNSLEASVPFVEAAGYEHGAIFETQNPYISAARATMLRAALTAGGDIFVFIDDDISWDRPEDLVKLIETPGDVVAGTYRTREDDPNYMGRAQQDLEGRITNFRHDGCIEMTCVPAGFLKITKDCVTNFMFAYPELCYGSPYNYSVDLFNHGAYKGLWWGEDYSFCRRWRDAGGQVWCVPDLSLDHNTRDGKTVWKGNFHQFLMRQPGGVKDGMPYDGPGYVGTISKEA